jgi:D-3-phosphoglycerate dehydrogenase
MERMRLAFFDRWTDPIAEEILNANKNIELVRLTTSDDPAKVWKELERAHGYQWPIAPYLGSRELVARCTNLLAMSSQGSGCDVMDFDACNEAGILIVNQAGLGGHHAVASHALGMMLALSKNIIQSHHALRRDRTSWKRMDYIGHDLFDKTVGIVGFGEIGSRTGQLCKAAFNMNVLAYDPYLTAEQVKARGGTKVDRLGDLLARSDFVSVHCPLTDETRGMIGAEEFARMKPGSYFVTAARGTIHDEAALETALKKGDIAGAGLDVWAEEPPPLDHPLLHLDNVICSIHIAGLTREAYRSVGEGAALQWIEILEGRRPPRLVNPEVWPKYLDRFQRVAGRAVAA